MSFSEALPVQATPREEKGFEARVRLSKTTKDDGGGDKRGSPFHREEPRHTKK